MDNTNCCSFILKGQPASPTMNEVFYIEAEYDEEVNAIVRENLAFIQDYLRTRMHKSFFYLPALSDALLRECCQYHAPGVSISETSIKQVTTSSLLSYLADPTTRSLIRPGFAKRNSNYVHEVNGAVEYNLFYFDVEAYHENPKGYLRYLCNWVSDDSAICGLHTISFVFDDYQTTVGHDSILVQDEEMRELIQQMKDIAQRLYAKGIGECYIRELIGQEQKLSRLRITKDFKIILPDFDNMEIVMEPLCKALYFLFLRYPEGIAFKEMINYRDELYDIYLQIWSEKEYATVDMGRISTAIDNLCNPLSNSINEKTSRIKALFVKKMHDDIAKHYYINGRYAEPRSIALPQDMVIWEADLSFFIPV